MWSTIRKTTETDAEDYDYIAKTTRQANAILKEHSMREAGCSWQDSAGAKDMDCQHCGEAFPAVVAVEDLERMFLVALSSFEPAYKHMEARKEFCWLWGEIVKASGYTGPQAGALRMPEAAKYLTQDKPETAPPCKRTGRSRKKAEDDR